MENIDIASRKRDELVRKKIYKTLVHTHTHTQTDRYLTSTTTTKKRRISVIDLNNIERLYSKCGKEKKKKNTM